METVSLYDKYHSEHNKNYMYNLITQCIQKNNNVNMSTNTTYNQFFETNFTNTFQKVDTEDLKDLNKHLLDTQVDYYNQFISKQNIITNEPIKVTNDVKETKDIQEDNLLLHSLHRIINLQQSSRFSYRVVNKIEGKECQLEKIILPIEDNFLFANPILTLSVDNTRIDLHLRGTMKLGTRDYGLYTPFYESTFTLTSDKVQISLNSQLSTTKKSCDVYKIESNDKGYLQMSYTNGEFLVGDYVRICNFENIELDDHSCLKEQYKVSEVTENGIRIEGNSTVKHGLYVMNISLQHSIHVSYR
jgi:hypothetical protein